MKTVCAQNETDRGELEQILRQHARCYPCMEPTDAVKLLYQNEFGGGHLIRDEASCLRYLQAEYDAVEKDREEPTVVPVGNGIVRVNLSLLSAAELERLGMAFLRSARDHHGTMASFHQKLDVLRKVTEEAVFSFDLAALDGYLTAYYAAGCPMVSHSEQYRRAYRPAYRVVLEEYLAER